MYQMIAAVFCRVSVAVILTLLVQSASVRASIIISDIGMAAVPNEVIPGNAEVGGVSKLVAPGRHASRAILPNATSAQKPACPNSPAQISLASLGCDAVMLDVLSKNVDPNAARTNSPHLEPGQLTSRIRPEDSHPGLPSLLKEPGTDIDVEDGPRIHETVDIVFAESR